MSEDTQIQEDTQEPIRGPQMETSADDRIADLERRLEEAEKAVKLAEKNKTRANNEAAKHRTRNKEFATTLADALGAETGDPSAVVSKIEDLIADVGQSKQWRAEALAKEACEAAHIPAHTGMHLLKGAGVLDNLDISDTEAARSELEAQLGQFAEKHPGLVVREEPKTIDPWNTPEPKDSAANPSDVVAYLERIALDEPERLLEEYERLGGDKHIRAMGTSLTL